MFSLSCTSIELLYYLRDVFIPGNVTPVKATPVKAEPPQKEVARKKHNAALRFLQFILFSGRADENQKRPLPYWTLYIAYVLVFLTTMVSALFVMLYGFSFGKDISEKWVVTLLVSLFESFFLFQPIKVRGVFMFIVL